MTDYPEDVADAIRRWQAGREVWNAWADANPGAHVNFEGVDFSADEFAQFRTDDGAVSFAMFRFPGEADFSNATFGDSGVDFSGARFGDSSVDFRYARFGDGDVDFKGATFGNGNVYFKGATFGNGNVYFQDATFGNGQVDLAGSTIKGVFLFEPTGDPSPVFYP